MVAPTSTMSSQIYGDINDVKSLKNNKCQNIVEIPYCDVMNISTMEELEGTMDRLHEAQQVFSSFTQAKVDQIVETACDHFIKNAKNLGQMAHDETGMGLPAHKEVKNHFAVDYVRKWYRNEKTCDIIESDEVNGIDVVASPMGIVAAIIPTTNPTSTVAFKALCCLKTRNAICVAPHPRAKKSTYEALRIIMEGAVAGGAPVDLAACISEPSLELSGSLMKHSKTSLVLATGGPGMVQAAYSSGHPAVGVGPGNVPVVVDSFANLKDVAQNVVSSKNFDYGVICSSEQVVIAEESIYDQLKREFIVVGAYFLNDDEKKCVSELLFKNGGALNADVVGQSPTKIASMAGIEVPSTTTLLVAEFDEVKTSAFAREKLSPCLGFTKRSNVDELFETAVKVLKLGGEGHTACYYTNQFSQASRIQRFASTVTVTRCLINQPTAPGGIGGVYNFGMAPSMTLGCGSYGGNYVSDNVGPKHLLNFKRVARIADDHMIVMHNIDLLVPPHRAVRCAMEILILSIVLVAKDSTILQPHPVLIEINQHCIKFMKGEGNLQQLREGILYFTQTDLYKLGHLELNLETVAKEFNIPFGNIYPILFPQVAQHLEAVDWTSCKALEIGVESIDTAVELIQSLQKASGMEMSFCDSTKERILRSGVSTIADTIR